MKRPLVLALATLCLLACEKNRGSAARELDDSTIAVLNTARALHQEADIYESHGDYTSAAQTIERVLEMRIPPGVEEAEDIRADARGRLGEIALEANNPDAALEEANTGLRDTHRDSVLRARLYVVKGRALRALADRAQGSGDTTQADARRREAFDALETSIEINQRILGRLTDGGGT